MAGFHTYIWQVDSHGTPEYLSIHPEIEGECKVKFEEKFTVVYLKLIRTTIFVFSHKLSKFPEEIINLEGLTVLSV